MTVKIIEMLIPKTNKRNRPGTKRKPKTITIHETANTNVRANALAHARLQYLGNARQASWHLQVDDEQEVYLSVPYDEVAYAAGDGGGPGNSYSIHLEVCVNQDGNFKGALHNAAETVRYLLNKFPSITHIDVVQHHKWSGKDCPKYLRSGVKGVDWNGFLKMVRNEGKADVQTPSTPPKYETTNTNFKVGQKVRVKKSAKTYATGQSIPAFVKGKTDTIMQRGSNRMLLKGIFSWVKTSDLEVVGNTTSNPTPTPKPSSTYKGNSIVDYLVSIKEDSSYGNRKKLAAKHGIKNYSGTEAQNLSLLNKLRGGASPSPAAKPKTYKVGHKVKIKSNAKKYSRSTASIPTRFKNKSYTIQQVGKDDVLIKELFSWVKKSDIS